MNKLYTSSQSKRPRMMNYSQKESNFKKIIEIFKHLQNPENRKFYIEAKPFCQIYKPKTRLYFYL